MSVDFAKLNKPGLGNSSFGVKRKNTGVSAQAAKNLANSSAATKMSIFSNTRSPNFVSGHNVAKQSSRYSYQGARMRANTPFVPKRGYSVPIPIPAKADGKSGIDKFTENMQKAIILGQTIQTGVSTITGIVNAFSGSSQLTQSLSSLGSPGAVAALSTMSGQLSAASSFTDINNVETKMNGQKASINTDYQSIGTTTQSSINTKISDANVAQGLSDAGISAPTLPALTNPLDMTDLGNADGQINTDISNIQSFANGLNTDIGKLNTKKATAAQTIASKQLQLDQLKANNPSDPRITTLTNEITTLQTQKENFEKAELALKDVQTQCGTMIDDLKAKQADIKDIKNTEDQLAQKKYDLAKSQEKELNNLMKKLDKLNKDPSKNATEIASLKKQVGQIVQSFTAAGVTTIANPKGGQAINIADALNKASAYT